MVFIMLSLIKIAILAAIYIRLSAAAKEPPQVVMSEEQNEQRRQFENLMRYGLGGEEDDKADS